MQKQIQNFFFSIISFPSIDISNLSSQSLNKYCFRRKAINNHINNWVTLLQQVNINHERKKSVLYC